VLAQAREDAGGKREQGGGHRPTLRVPLAAVRQSSAVPLELPPAVEIDLESLRRRHGLRGPIEQMPDAGIFNTVFAVGRDLILRVPRDDPFFVSTALKETIAVPAARRAGVRTPAIVVADATREIVPVPYAIYERAEGDTLERLAGDPAVEAAVWRELGRDLRRLHGIAPDAELSALACERLPDVRKLLEASTREGHVSAVEERWLAGWLDTLEQAGEGPERLVHGDVQAPNVMASRSPSGLVYTGVIDWGGCGWHDPANDFAGMPLRAVPAMLDGYGPVDEAFRARIVRRQLQVALFCLRRGPQPGRSWAERPAAMLIDVLRFFADAPPGWTGVRPPR